MDNHYIEELGRAKRNPLSQSSRRFQPLGVASYGGDQYDDNASIGAQTLVTLEEGVRHALEHWKVVLLGQILSFLTASAGAAQAGLHLECNVSAPFVSIAMTFFLLSFFLIPLYRQRGETIEDPSKPQLFGITLRAPLAVYFLLAAMEVQASYWTVKAFRYTTITSITLLDALWLPTVMVLSRFLLKRRYMGVHVLGAMVCLAGVVVNMLADYTSDWQTINDPYPNKIVGDAFAVSGAMMMAVIHVYSEVFVSDVSGPIEYLGVVGFFAFPIALVASLLFERTENVYIFQGSECSAGMSSALLFTTVAAKSMDLSGTAGFLLISEATLLNLSLLTTDLWSAVFSILLEGIMPPLLFWAALVVVFLGIFIYEMGPSPAPHSHELHPFEDTINKGEGKHFRGTVIEIT